jgi:hypothetical protein
MRGKKCKSRKYAPKCVGKSAKVESMHQNPRKKVQKPKVCTKIQGKRCKSRKYAPKSKEKGAKTEKYASKSRKK